MVAVLGTMSLWSNLSDVAEGVAMVVAVREALVGWVHSNLDVVNAVREAHRTAMMVRRSLS